MTEKTSTLTLDEAWAKRQALWLKGTALIADGNKMWKEIVNLPGSSRIGIWFNISESCKEAAKKVYDGYMLRTQADEIWHDAVIAAKGPKSRVTWENVPEKKADRCILDSGEVFEP